MSETPYNTGITDDQIRAINARAMQAVDRDAELETLRDERDRLKRALEEIAMGTAVWERDEMIDCATAALTPAGGQDEK